MTLFITGKWQKAVALAYVDNRQLQGSKRAAKTSFVAAVCQLPGEPS